MRQATRTSPRMTETWIYCQEVIVPSVPMVPGGTCTANPIGLYLTPGTTGVARSMNCAAFRDFNYESLRTMKLM